MEQHPGRASVRNGGSMRRTLAGLVMGCGVLLALGTGYLLTLAIAALCGPRVVPMPLDRRRMRFLVLVPAHNEVPIVAHTVRALLALDYPRNAFEVIVVADNCDDRTADVAAAAGATVLSRSNPTQRGKGYAIAWAVERLQARDRDWEAVAVLDADCTPSPNLLTAMESRLRSGAAAVQVNNVVGNPEDSWSSALRFAAFALINTVRPRGKERLGLSSGLFGTGMGLSRGLLERVPWSSFSLAEDGEYHFRVVAAGERAAFAREAAVVSAMPTSLRQARSQQLRWEGGRWQLIRNWTPRLLRAGWRARDARTAVIALEPLIPPQSLLIAGNVLLAVLAVALRSRAARAIAVGNLIGQAAFVLGGLALVRAPAAVYRSLALAPVLVVWKVALWGRVVSGRGATRWVRTERTTST